MFWTRKLRANCDGYYESLYRFALTLAARSRGLRLTQETFHQLRGKAPDSRRVQVKSWLFTTLYHEFVDAGARAPVPAGRDRRSNRELPVTQPDLARR